jgi:hypothetical protein
LTASPVVTYDALQWQSHAACRDDPAPFDLRLPDKAVEVCRTRCPVIGDCAAHALALNSVAEDRKSRVVGVWAGVWLRYYGDDQSEDALLGAIADFA